MKLGKGLILFSIVSIVFLAGCARAPSAPTGTGVVITSFSPDIDAIDGPSDVTFSVSVKNLGEKLASFTRAEIFGLSNEWDEDTGAAVVQPFDTMSADIGSLSGVDPSVGLPGETGTADFTLTSPAGKTSDMTYEVTTRVSYAYSTAGDAQLRILTPQYLRTNPDAQKGVISSSFTSGPLIVNIVARTPVASGGKARIQFEIQNTGGGRTFSVTATTQADFNNIDKLTNIDRLSEVIITSSSDLKNCAGVDDNNGKDQNRQDNIIRIRDEKVDVINGVSLRLVGGKSKVISCDIAVGTITNFQDITVGITLNYNYFVDSATSVTVFKALQ